MPIVLSSVPVVRVLNGDCREVLKTLPDGSVNCCVTSPPYFGLRDYGHPGQIGLEPTPEAYVAQMVAVFREVKRVLRDDGTLWLNLGDSYASMKGAACGVDAKGGAARRFGKRPQDAIMPGFKPKDLIGIPWRVAFALQADGWYLRQDIIWHKPNPMPESVTDRCTKAHEYIFLLSKSERYWFDSEAMKEPATSPPMRPRNKAEEGWHEGCGSSNCAPGDRVWGESETRNRRSVWTVATKPYKGAHFATFPSTLIEPCILAGCPKGGVVLDPFGGSGTTGEVAKKHGRAAILVELNPDYLPLIHDRTNKES